MASRNQALLEIVTNVQTRLMRYYYQVIVMDSYGSTLVDEHRELVRALSSRKAEVARARALDHLNKTVERSQKVDLRFVNHAEDVPKSPFSQSVWLTSVSLPVTAGRKRVRKTSARAFKV